MFKCHLLCFKWYITRFCNKTWVVDYFNEESERPCRLGDGVLWDIRIYFLIIKRGWINKNLAGHTNHLKPHCLQISWFSNYLLWSCFSASNLHIIFIILFYISTVLSIFTKIYSCLLSNFRLYLHVVYINYLISLFSYWRSWTWFLRSFSGCLVLKMDLCVLDPIIEQKNFHFLCVPQLW